MLIILKRIKQFLKAKLAQFAPLPCSTGYWSGLGGKPALNQSFLCPHSAYSENYTCSKCGFSSALCQRWDEAKRKRERRKLHGFHWQLLNKLKEHDAGRLSLLRSLLQTKLVPSQEPLLRSDELFRCWICGGGEDISLKRGARQRAFSSISLPFQLSLFIQRCKSGRNGSINHNKLVGYFCFSDWNQYFG